MPLVALVSYRSRRANYCSKDAEELTLGQNARILLYAIKIVDSRFCSNSLTKDLIFFKSYRSHGE